MKKEIVGSIKTKPKSSLSRKVICLLFAVTLVLGLLPAGSLTDTTAAKESDGSIVVEGIKRITGNNAPVHPFDYEYLTFDFRLTQVGNIYGAPLSGTPVTQPLTVTVEPNNVLPYEYPFSFPEISGLTGGPYFFKIEELPPTPFAGSAWSFDLDPKIVEVYVDIDGSCYQNDVPIFHNKFLLAGVPVNGTKVLSGIDVTDRSFDFCARQVMGMGEHAPAYGGYSPLYGPAMGQGGVVNVTGSQSFSFVVSHMIPEYSPYYFKVYEDQGGNGEDGWVYSDAAFWLCVEVDESGDGAIGTITEIQDAEGRDVTTEGISFINTYEAAPGSLSITGTKALSGITSTNKTFTFEAIQVSSLGANSYTGTGTAKNATGTVTGAGNFDIDLAFDEEGTYFFKITEDQTGDGSDGWTYAKNAYWVEVEVVDDGYGSLVPSIKSEQGEKTFTNTYEAEADSVTITGTKALSGITSTDKTFTFEANQVDSSGANSYTGTDTAKSATGTVAGAGSFNMGISFDKEGEYYFKVTENQTGNGEEGWLYDNSAYWVKVTVTDDLNGKLQAQIDQILGANGQDLTNEGITFTNTYEKIIIPNPNDPKLSVVKKADSTTVEPGGKLRYTITVKNKSKVDAKDIIIKDVLPMYTTYESSNPEGTLSKEDGKDCITWNIPTLKAGETIKLYLTVNIAKDIPKGHTIKNTIFYTGIDLSGSSNTETVTYDGKPKTGDNSSPGLLVLIAAVAVLAAIGAAIPAMRRKWHQH